MLFRIIDAPPSVDDDESIVGVCRYGDGKQGEGGGCNAADHARPSNSTSYVCYASERMSKLSSASDAGRTTADGWGSDSAGAGGLQASRRRA